MLRELVAIVTEAGQIRKGEVTLVAATRRTPDLVRGHPRRDIPADCGLSADLENTHKFVGFISRANWFIVVVYGASCKDMLVY